MKYVIAFVLYITIIVSAAILIIFATNVLEKTGLGEWFDDKTDRVADRIKKRRMP